MPVSLLVLETSERPVVGRPMGMVLCTCCTLPECVSYFDLGIPSSSTVLVLRVTSTKKSLSKLLSVF